MHLGRCILVAMKHIGDNLKRVMNKSKETERGELMDYFRQKLNMDRVKDGYPPLSMGRMGKMLEKIPTKDLYYLKRVCDDAKNFSKKFWWELKPKEDKDTQR
jgi:hypothetical protein